MANYTKLLKGIEQLAKKSNIPIKLANVKFLVKLSILPGEHISISDLKRKLLGGKLLELANMQEASPGRFTKEFLKEARELIKKAKEFYLTPEWKKRAVEYAGMTDKEAEATAKFLSSNINRYALSPRALPHGQTYGKALSDLLEFTKGGKQYMLPASGVGIIKLNPEGLANKTPIHEAHHAAMLGKGTFVPSLLGVTDPDVIEGMNKFNKHIVDLGKELKEGYIPTDNIKEENLSYVLNPVEIRSRMLTGLTEGHSPHEIPNYIDPLRKYVNPDVYANVAKKMLVAAPVGLGLTAYNQE